MKRQNSYKIRAENKNLTKEAFENRSTINFNKKYRQPDLPQKKASDCTLDSIVQDKKNPQQNI